MELIMGGAYQGKLAFAKKQYPDIVWTDGEICEFDEIERCKGIYHFHCLIGRMLKNGEDMQGFASYIYEKNPGIIIITDEIGYGIVPAEPFEREYRECTGRVCTEIAARSEKVCRVISGIGMVIKG